MKGICRLCLVDTDLKDSHLLPRALYRHIRKRTDSEAVRVTPTQITQHSKQVSDYLLGSCCEDRFNKRGEKWVLENYPQNNGGFPLQEALLQAAPKKVIGGDKYYKAASVSGLDAQKISYFAISVFWRAAAHKWSFLGHDQKLNFGCYEEKLRLFLLDQGPFPDEAALHIVVSPNKNFQDGALAPSTYATKPVHRHGFSIPGILFALSLGNLISQEEKEECIFHADVICLSTKADDLAQKARNKLIAGRAHP